MYAVFTMVLLQSSQLQTGHLIFYNNQNQIMKIVPATSGQAGSQCLSCQWKRGRGPIPERPDGYEIDVKGRYRLATKGIEGIAMPLSPDPVYGPQNTIRTEIMLHRDVGLDGSAGCLVLHLSPKEYEKFVVWLANASKKQKKVPLKVRYSTPDQNPIRILIKLARRIGEQK
jgi:hypothetical protein